VCLYSHKLPSTRFWRCSDHAKPFSPPCFPRSSPPVVLPFAATHPHLVKKILHIESIQPVHLWSRAFIHSSAFLSPHYLALPLLASVKLPNEPAHQRSTSKIPVDTTHLFPHTHKDLPVKLRTCLRLLPPALRLLRLAIQAMKEAPMAETVEAGIGT